MLNPVGRWKPSHLSLEVAIVEEAVATGPMNSKRDERLPKKGGRKNDEDTETKKRGSKSRSSKAL